MNPNSKLREIARLVKHAKPKLILSCGPNINARAVADSAGIRFIDMEEKPGHLPSGDVVLREEAQEALILYTSGTTGDPKGVVLTHQNLLANTVSIIEYLSLSSDDSAVVALPFHLGYGNSVLQSHLYVGASLVIGDSMMYPQLVVNQLRQFKVSGFPGVPTTFSLLLSRSDFSQNPPPLRYVTQAGAAMGRSLTKRLRDSLHPKTSLFIMYGQTEATARLTCLPPERIDEKIGSAGKPIPGVEIRISRRNGTEAEMCEVGEVLARGRNVMNRYWENPGQTATTIVDGWLHTGDLGFVDAEGFLFLQGRESEMIKTGSHRVSPREIEDVISEIEQVDEVAVCGVPDEILGQTIVAFVVGSESEENRRLILAHCQRSLTTHKIPRDIVWKSALPKAASGKIVKRALVENVAKSKVA